MAKQFGKDSAVDFAPANLMSFGKSFATLNGQPLVKSEVWYDKAALEEFALTDAAYVGQKVVFVDLDGNKVYNYAIQIDGSLEEIGSSVIGDEKTINVAEDGTISLFGIEGLELERTDENGATAKINYQPLLVDGKLTWVEPSATTVEGLAAEIEGIKTRLSTLEGEGEGSVRKIAEKAADDRLNKFAADVSDDGVVNTFKELVDYVAQHGAEAADMAADILELQGFVGNKAVSVQITEKIDEALKVDGADKYALATELAAWVEKTKDAEKNVIASASDEFTIDENRKISLKSVSADKVSGLPDALAKKVNAEDSKGLSANDFTDALKSKLETVNENADENLIEAITFGGTAAEIAGKTVDIPFATAMAVGLVKGSGLENGISVADDGSMSVNSVNINKLVQTDGDILILDGGSAEE